ncbi:MAG: hypothetical protein AVDCRST_MAG49-1311 [uncultured Thermomicrobiales bacterium]|uniref:Uncharacterized protein n=1 Tax=uncultured Thermomicrobiales bacterium TaxID=1645740 RepID=A0A6J4U9A6_9BACT|nr:MAG: hypothetical protein AVDCRST_MAG49-1311 [uncultured Thermomicrobiales bacterium]
MVQPIAVPQAVAGLDDDARGGQGASGLVYVDPVPVDGRGRRLLATVEPLEPGGRGIEVAGAALQALREAFVASAGLSTQTALARSFAAADAAVRALNRLRPSGGRHRRVLVGATAIVVDADGLTLAYVPPSQAMIVQDGVLYGVPDLASWRPDYEPTSDAPDPEPLGQGGTVAPALFRTLARPADLLLLCPTAVGRLLADTEVVAGFAPSEETEGEARGSLLAGRVAPWGLRGDAARAQAWLRPLAESAGIPASRVPCAAVGRLPRPEPVRRRPAGEEVSTPVPLPDAVVHHGRAAVARERMAMAEAGPVREVPAPLPLGVSGCLVQPPTRGEILTVPVARLAAARAGGDAVSADRAEPLWVGDPDADARWTPSRREPAAAAPGRVETGTAGPPVALGGRPLPGALGLGRHRAAGGGVLPLEWRVRLPRMPRMVPPRSLAVVAAVGLLVVVGGGIARERQAAADARAGRVDAALATVDGHLRAAEQAVGGAIEDPLAGADAALAAAIASGAREAQLEPRRAVLGDLRDRARGVVRLPAVALGGLPAEVVGKGDVRLVRAGGELYVVAGGVYRLRADGQGLDRLLAPGQRVDGVTVGVLREAAPAGSGLIATDGAALFLLEADGRWRGRPLGGWPADGAGPCGAYDQNLYCLDRGTGRLVRVANGVKPDPQPAVAEDWADGAITELGTGIDLVVDGRIHVLLADGRVASYYRGEPDGEATVVVEPPLTAPVAMDGGGRSGSLYIVDPGDGRGRIVRLGASGELLGHFVPVLPDLDPGEASPLGAPSDVVVDETAGMLFLVADDALWQVNLAA